jgi:hypothetical protein
MWAAVARGRALRSQAIRADVRAAAAAVARGVLAAIAFVGRAIGPGSQRC